MLCSPQILCPPSGAQGSLISCRAESSQVTARGTSPSWTQAALCSALHHLSGTVHHRVGSPHHHTCVTGPPDPESPRLLAGREGCTLRGAGSGLQWAGTRCGCDRGQPQGAPGCQALCSGNANSDGLAVRRGSLPFQLHPVTYLRPTHLSTPIYPCRPW